MPDRPMHPLNVPDEQRREAGGESMLSQRPLHSVLASVTAVTSLSGGYRVNWKERTQVAATGAPADADNKDQNTALISTALLGSAVPAVGDEILIWPMPGKDDWFGMLLGTRTSCCPTHPPTTTFPKACSGSGSGTLCCVFKVECYGDGGIASVYLDTVDCFGRKITDAQMIQDCNDQIDQIIEFDQDLCPGDPGLNLNPCGPTGGAVPGRICIHIYGGTRAYRSIISYQVESQFSADAGGWPFSYTTPDGLVTITGTLVPTTDGFEFKGTITSDLDDPDHPSGFPCGCVVDNPAQTTTITCGADSSHPDIGGTIHIVTDCGELYIDVSPAPCVFVPSFNCVSGYCLDPGDGTGTYPSLALCEASGCAPPAPESYNCIADTCVNPGDGTGTYSTLADCLAAPCEVGARCCDAELSTHPNLTITIPNGTYAGTWTGTWNGTGWSFDIGGADTVTVTCVGGSWVIDTSTLPGSICISPFAPDSSACSPFVLTITSGGCFPGTTGLIAITKAP